MKIHHEKRCDTDLLQYEPIRKQMINSEALYDPRVEVGCLQVEKLSLQRG